MEALKQVCVKMVQINGKSRSFKFDLQFVLLEVAVATIETLVPEITTSERK